ncbi:DrmB family protein [Streptomyces smyrnaeus]|uniref:DrmB family protein n=1 Tax=Streptomyces smyrnaeus TaxID=1387713 RepID=UPI0036AB5952
MTSGTSTYFRRVGTVRPSHLMFTGGVGALVDLPNFSVIVKGLDSWDYQDLTREAYRIDEPRLRKAVNRALERYNSAQVTMLRAAPWRPGAESDNHSDAAQRTGVPVSPFPQWLRCTACNELGAVDSPRFEFVNTVPSAPHEAKFVHECDGRRRKRLAVAARFTLVCENGHLDEFPYVEFVHRGGTCRYERPRLRMVDFGGNQAANVQIQCQVCDASRNVREVLGEAGSRKLPRCRGRHPHLDTFDPGGCSLQTTLLVAGASNQWFPLTLTALALPQTQTAGDRVAELVDQRWAEVETITTRQVFDILANTPSYDYLREVDPEALIAAVQARRSGTSAQQDSSRDMDLLGPEWRTLSGDIPAPSDDFALRDVGMTNSLKSLFGQVRQVERLREVRALVGFTRLDAPDPENPEVASRVELSNGRLDWVPASEVRGEGIFLRADDDLLNEWAQAAEASSELAAHREAYLRFKENRRSNRRTPTTDPLLNWPGARYIVLHTLSHLMIRTIALECGYNSASLSERIYAGSPDEPRSGILIYTAVPDSEGTLGGLVTRAEPPHLERLVRQAFVAAQRCSSDPLCAERLPQAPYDYLHGAACHACLFLSETTCERGNRFLDRRFVVPLGNRDDLALVPPELRV